MRRFTLHNKSHDLLTGLYVISYSFATDRRSVKAAVTTFGNIETMENYLAALQRDWLLGCLDDYVKHKRIIIEIGKHPKQDEALRKCTDALDDFHAKDRPLKTICQQFLKGREHFATILPHPGNDSHASSAANLREITAFCDEYLKNCR